MICILGTIVGNTLFPKGGKGICPQNGEAALPGEPFAAFATLFRNAENRPDAGGNAVERESPASSDAGNAKQPDFGLLGFAAANSFLMGNNGPIVEAGGRAPDVSVGAADLAAVGKPAFNPALTADSIQAAEGSEQAGAERVPQGPRENDRIHAFGKPEAKAGPVQNRPGVPGRVPEGVQANDSVAPENAFGKTGAKADSAENAQFGQSSAVQSERRAIPEASAGQNSGIADQKRHPKAKAEPLADRTGFSAVNADGVFAGASENAGKDVPVPADDPKNAFLLEKIGAEAESVANAQQQDSAFQSGLKAFQTELDAKTGFRQNRAGKQNTAESANTGGGLLQTAEPSAVMKDARDAAAWQSRKAPAHPSMEEPNGVRGVALDAGQALSTGAEQKAKDAGGTDAGRLALRSKKEPSPAEKMHDFGAAAHSPQVHSTSHAQAGSSETQTADGVVTQLEASIKKEASKGVSTSFRIRLKPEGLGEVTVDLKHVSGGLEISIKTELSATKELISEGIQTLKNALAADSDPKLTTLLSLTVEQDARQFGAFEQGGFSESRQSRSESAGNAFGGFHEAAERKAPGTVRFRTGLIDYTV